jgi:hypothetical protein
MSAGLNHLSVLQHWVRETAAIATGQQVLKSLFCFLCQLQLTSPSQHLPSKIC